MYSVTNTYVLGEPPLYGCTLSYFGILLVRVRAGEGVYSTFVAPPPIWDGTSDTVLFLCYLRPWTKIFFDLGHFWRFAALKLPNQTMGPNLKKISILFASFAMQDILFSPKVVVSLFTREVLIVTMFKWASINDVTQKIQIFDPHPSLSRYHHIWIYHHRFSDVLDVTFFFSQYPPQQS